MSQKKKRDPLEIASLMNERHAVSPTAQQCTATSKRTGERCKAWAIRGARTCRMHGSATRRARVAAAERISQASGYAADMLVEFMADPTVDLKYRISIADKLLDRAGLNQQNIAVQIQQERWANVMEGVLVDVTPDEEILDAEVVEEPQPQPETSSREMHVQPTPSPRAVHVQPTAKQRRADQAEADAEYERKLLRRMQDDPDSPEYRPRLKRRR